MGETRVTLNEAASIMGKQNFHGPTVVKRHLGVNLRHRSFNTVPFGADVLPAVASTHVLIAAPAVSIMDVHAKASQAFYSQRNPWYCDSRQDFAHEKCQPGWYLVRKDEVPGSTRKRWSEQRDMVQTPDFVPDANVAVYAWILHYLATGERMFANAWVRTNSVAANGHLVRLDGHADGLDVYSGWGESALSDIGVAEARKPS